MRTLSFVVLPAASNDLRGRAQVAAQSQLARTALERSARDAGATLAELAKDSEDAPLPSNGWHWSLSHTTRFAAGAVCRNPIGIDVEEIAPRKQEIVPRVTSRAELELLGGFQWDRFMRVWTAKEAVLKKAGCGLLELSRCTLVAVPDGDSMVLQHRGREHFVHQRTRARHVASLTHDGDPSLDLRWTWIGEFPSDSSAASEGA